MLLALVSPVLAGLLINEVMYDPTGADAGLEWVELCNDTDSTIDLAGYQLESAGASYTEVYTFVGGTVAPGAYLLVGGGSSTHAATFSPNLQNGGTETDGLRIKNAIGTVIDTVLYDGPNISLAEDDGTVPLTGAPAAGSGSSIGRFPDCTDTDVSESNFVLYDLPSPVSENPDLDSDCTGSDDVSINELVYTTGAEWIELYNGGAGAAVLDGWVIEFGTRAYDKTEALPPGTTLGPGEWLVVGSAGALVKDLEIDLDLGNAANTDAIRLRCNTLPVDTVVYGGPNTDLWTDDSGAEAASLAPDHGEGQSIARITDGFDTDVCGVDFALSTAPTPGATNPVIEPAVCVVNGAGGIKINEFVYDTDGDDAGNEWVELFNAGNNAVRLDAYTLQTAGTSWGEDFRFPGGVSLEPGGLVLVGGESVGDVDHLADNLALDNAGSGAGGLRLLDCEGGVLDTVLYGDPAIEDDIAGDGGSLDVVSKVSAAYSLGRFPDGGDSNSAADWFPYAAPSPGELNVDPGARGDGPDGPSPGCGNQGTPAAPGEGGCGTVLPLGGLEVGLAALAMVRRRRRRVR